MPTSKSPRKKSSSARPAARRIQRSTRSQATRPAVETRRQASAIPTVSLPTSTWSNLVLVFAAAILAFGLFLVFRTPAVAPTSTTQEQVVSYVGVDGKNALELLKSTATVETQNYEGIGELVTSINGIPSTAENYWIFYVNGEQAQVGAGEYITKSTDQLSWRYEQAQQ
jgi:hypothetical protein